MQSLVQNGRLVITRRFNESFIIRPDSKVRSLLPVEVLFTNPIVVTVMQGEQDAQVQFSVQADKRLNIVRSEFVDESELKGRNSLLYRNDLDLIEHRNLLKDELVHIDEHEPIFGCFAVHVDIEMQLCHLDCAVHAQFVRGR